MARSRARSDLKPSVKGNGSLTVDVRQPAVLMEGEGELTEDEAREEGGNVLHEDHVWHPAWSAVSIGGGSSGWELTS